MKRIDSHRLLLRAARMHSAGDLTTPQWHALRLRLGGRTWQTIAEVMGCSMSSARTHYRRAAEKVGAPIPTREDA